jgi:outer membrane protein TolC
MRQRLFPQKPARSPLTNSHPVVKGIRYRSGTLTHIFELLYICPREFFMKRLFILIVLLPLTGGAGLAAEVTLQDALRAAVADRPGVQMARARAEAAAAAVDEARSGWLPRLTLQESYARTDEPAGNLFMALNQEHNVMADPAYDLVDPDARDDFETRLQLTQTLYDPTVDFGLRRARTAARAATADAAWNTEETAFAAFQAYLEVQHAEAALAWVTSARDEAGEIARLASERREAGVGRKADELRAAVQLAEARRRELAAANDLTLARRRLALAMGVADGERRIAAPLDEKSFPTASPPDSPAGRADLAALGLQVEAAGLAVDQSRAEWLPRLGLSASYAWHDEDVPFGADAEAWAVGAGLNWELFDGLRRSAAGARAEASQRAAAARFEEARRELAFRLEEARLRAEEARLQRDSARQAVLEASESRRLFQQRYEAGLLDLADLLAAQSALDRARFDAAGTESRHLLALGNVYFQGGRFLETFLTGEEPRP